MRQNPWQVWHRCGTCGTIFSDLAELREHEAQHGGLRGRFTRVETPEKVDSQGVPVQDRRFDPARRKDHRRQTISDRTG